MNYLTGSLIAESFPEVARVVYGLSKREFASEPEIEILALRNGLLMAAVHVGHFERVATFLKNPRVRSVDIHKVLQKVCDNNILGMVKVLLADNRLSKDPLRLRRHAIGQYSPGLAELLLASPSVKIAPSKRDILYAAFAPCGRKESGRISDLRTMQFLLADPRYASLKPDFYQRFCQCIEGILEYDQWKENGEFVNIPWFYDGKYVSYTNYEELYNILKKDKRFAPYIIRF